MYTNHLLGSLAVAGLLLNACGGGGGATGAGAPPPMGSLALLAGNIGGAGNVDGLGAAARFQTPFALAVDSAGNVFVADSDNHTIRKITPSGEVTAFAGAAGQSGSDDGAGGAARFEGPTGIAFDAADNVYVSDTNNNTIRRITPAGVVTTFAGSPGPCGSADGAGAAAQFCGPSGLAMDAGGNLFVADQGNHTIRMITAAAEVSTVAGTPGVAGAADGVGGAAQFSLPFDVAPDNFGNLYIADTGNHTIRLMSSSADVSTLVGSAGDGGATDGAGASARFFNPAGVVADAAGNAYVADTGNHLIRRITPAGDVTTFAGTANAQGPDDGAGASARFDSPFGIAIDGDGNLYVAEDGNDSIRKITPASEVTTLAGAAAISGSVDAQGPLARFVNPVAIAMDSTGNAYVADASIIRLIDTAGNVTSLSAAGLNGPGGLARDAAGNMYIADTNNHVIRKIDAGGSVTVLAGTPGNPGSADGPALSASFNTPSGVAIDPVAGKVYVADTNNHTVRVISPAGEVATLAGTPGSRGRADGNGALARFNFPTDLVCDAAGNLYVTDRLNHAIRRITPTGDVTTFAGSAPSSGAVDGTGPAARFSLPLGIAIDGAGNLFVADANNHTVRKITPAADVTTVVGAPGRIGVQLGELPGSLFSPRDVAVRGDGQLLIVTANGVVVTQGF